MQRNKLVGEFSTAYSNARILVQKGSADAAKRYVVRCLEILVSMYKQSSEVVARAKILALANKLKGVVQLLNTYGITNDVKVAFGIGVPVEQRPAAAKPRAATPAAPAPSVNAPVSPVAAQPKSIDDLIDSMSSNSVSQGWCADLFEKYRPSVVEIFASSNANSRMCGTGFVVSANGFILTNDHVVFNEETGAYHTKVTMRLYDNKTYSLEIVDSDAKNDVAICKYDVSTTPQLAPIPRIVNYSVLKQGADMLVIGNAFSLGLEPFSGTVRFTHDHVGDLVYTAPSNPGDSGGPVLNRAGECIGINKTETKSITIDGRTREANGMYNATPMDKIDELLAKWASKHKLNI